jgi:histidinol-phosphate aminotransferase
MSITRRALLERLGAGALSAAVVPRLAFAESEIVDGAVTPGPIRLHRNENAYGPSPKALAAMRNAAAQAARYPDDAASSLRAAIARLHDVSADRVLLGCGATELLHAAVQTFAGGGRTVVTARPTYEGLDRLAHRTGSRIVDVPLRPDYAHDVDGMLRHVTSTTGLVYICNPHNPTGTLTRRRDLDAFLSNLPAGVHLVVDEAYHEFVGQAADYRSLIDRTDDPRVIVLRSFSKMHALAGLRVGYAVAAPATVSTLGSHTADDINIVAARAAQAALGDREHIDASMNSIADERQEFLNQANARMLRSIDSLTNFVMLNTERPASGVVAHFARHRVLVAGSLAGFDKFIRVSIGTPAEMREFWRVWDLMPGGGHMMGL